ncbi:cytochrome P450 [Fomitiporia mediterranea MF3/22]|uniref:cytochrome P450 n=1 Tax=Fomitiporia mediterranea (strain MF3/22) TaxID=694068 RepID=UPI0004407EB6|nr:cytochrome P450 [Fomitiporia mediterranea MF3/22]EJC98496.1 cytochrome P450 [Fomitiporia mediterranea MF3/22]
MDLSTREVVAASIAAFVAWRLLRYLSTRSYLSYIPGPPSTSWWKGNFEAFYSPDGWAFHQDLYRNYGGVARLDMVHGSQELSVADPLALHHVLVKESMIYEETEVFTTTFGLTMGPSLLATQGEVHKKQRKMLNPVFSLKHMRDILPMFYPITYKLCDILETEVAKGEKYVDVMKWISRSALEFVGQGGFGYTFDAFNEKSKNAYSEDLKELLITLNKIDFLRQFFPLAVKLGPAWLRRKLVGLVPVKDVHRLAELTDIIEGHSKKILHQKRDALAKGDDAVREQIGRGKDIMSIILKANSEARGDDRVPDGELLAHMSTFIMAAHDTTTSATSRILYVLSRRQDVQTKLREELLAARREHGDIDYDSLMALPYLDAVCRETLRVHPPATHINRVTNKDTVLPLLWPLKSTDGKTEIKQIPLRKGTVVHISIVGANMSKTIWGEDSEEWKPERWLKPLPKSVDDAHLPGVYSQMMTFLGGGRACIGFKFAEMELKLALYMLLTKFLFEPGPEISWKIGFVQHPVINEPGFENGTVPLKVSLLA